jgi:trehalose-phosphatase
VAPGAHPWRGVIGPLLTAKTLLVALDFDGTLAPLVEDPDDARVLPSAAAALRRLSEAPDVVLALVSGRPAATLARLAQPPEGTLLVGSHGAEQGRMVAGRAVLEPVELSAARRARLDTVRASLEEVASTADGAWVEPKPFSAVLHTRPMRDRAAAGAVEKRAAALGAALGVHILPGKMVVEAAVLPTDKAGALTRLRAQVGADRMVFAGDDVTDELALKTIKPPDLGIKVGPGPSAAALRLVDPAAMAGFLKALGAVLAER